MTKVVLDTNIIVSAALRAEGNEAAVLNLAITGAVAMCVTPAILAEYAAVLARPALGIRPATAAALLAAIRATAVMVNPAVTVNVSRDEADNRFLECSESARANYLVTGNLRHFPQRWKGTAIVNSRTLLAAAQPRPKGPTPPPNLD